MWSASSARVHEKPRAPRWVTDQKRRRAAPLISRRPTATSPGQLATTRPCPQRRCRRRRPVVRQAAARPRRPVVRRQNVIVPRAGRVGWALAAAWAVWVAAAEGQAPTVNTAEPAVPVQVEYIYQNHNWYKSLVFSLLKLTFRHTCSMVYIWRIFCPGLLMYVRNHYTNNLPVIFQLWLDNLYSVFPTT